MHGDIHYALDSQTQIHLTYHFKAVVLRNNNKAYIPKSGGIRFSSAASTLWSEGGVLGTVQSSFSIIYNVSSIHMMSPLIMKFKLCTGGIGVPIVRYVGSIYPVAADNIVMANTVTANDIGPLL